MHQMYSCPSCGAAVIFGVQFCGNCGIPLNWSAQPQMPTPPAYRQRYGYQQHQWNYQQIPPHQQQYTYGQTIPTKKSTSPWLVLFITIIVIGVLGGAVFLALNTSQREIPLTTPSSEQTSPPTTNPPAVSNTPPADTTSPLITNVSVSSTGNNMMVTWATNEPATSQVEYGKTINYGSSTPLDESLSSSHSVTVNELELGISYHFRVKSKDNAGNQAISEDNTFTTLKPTPKLEVKVIAHNLNIESAFTFVSGTVQNTGEIAVAATEVTVLVRYGVAGIPGLVGKTFDALGSIISEPAVLEPGNSRDFKILVQNGIKMGYDISVNLIER